MPPLIGRKVIHPCPCDARQMWGAIVGVAAASLALAVLHQTLEATGLAPPKPEKPKELSEPGKDFQKKAGECLSEQGALSEQSSCLSFAAAMPA